jgi:hypothetical protein
VGLLSVGRQVQKTKVVKMSLNPEWRQRLNFSWDGVDTAKVTVMDWDQITAGESIPLTRNRRVAS